MPVPSFGLGTFRLKDDVVRFAVRTALELGYRALDTAQGYGNEGEIGETVEQSGVPRGELYLTTKIKPDNYGADKLVPSLRESLDKLRVEQVDLTLIHWPAPRGPVPAREYLAALADAHAQGLTREIGISNFTVAQVREARQFLGDVPIATNQVEIHPYLQNRRLVDFARQEGLHLTSYMTLAVGKVMDDPVLRDIARAHGDYTPAHVALAWALAGGHSVIPSSTRRENLAANLRAQELNLTEEDLARIAALDRGERIANPAHLAPDWD